MQENQDSGCVRCIFEGSEVTKNKTFSSFSEIYFARVGDVSEYYDRFKELISDFERERAGRFVHEGDRMTYVCCHAIVRLILSVKLGLRPELIEFVRGPYGKPYLNDNSLFFNITHTRDAFALIVTRGSETGIDMEAIDRTMNFRAIVRNFFSENEGNYIFTDEIGSSARFFTLWTRKEALLKALGTGIADNLPDVEVSEQENRIRSASFGDMLEGKTIADHYICSWLHSGFIISCAGIEKTGFNLQCIDNEKVLFYLKNIG